MICIVLATVRALLTRSQNSFVGVGAYAMPQLMILSVTEPNTRRFMYECRALNTVLLSRAPDLDTAFGISLLEATIIEFCAPELTLSLVCTSSLLESPEEKARFFVIRRSFVVNTVSHTNPRDT